MENHNEISEFIWGLKELIRNEYDAKDYLQETANKGG